MSAARYTLISLDGLPPWAVVLVATVSTAALNATKIAALVDALSRAAVRLAVAWRLARPTKRIDGADPTGSASGELSSADVVQLARDALSPGTAVPDRPDPDKTGSPPAPPGTPAPPPVPPSPPTDGEKPS